LKQILNYFYLNLYYKTHVRCARPVTDSATGYYANSRPVSLDPVWPEGWLLDIHFPEKWPVVELSIKKNALPMFFYRKNLFSCLKFKHFANQEFLLWFQKNLKGIHENITGSHQRIELYYYKNLTGGHKKITVGNHNLKYMFTRVKPVITRVRYVSYKNLKRILYENLSNDFNCLQNFFENSRIFCRIVSRIEL
jgi:hypothetical protein